MELEGANGRQMDAQCGLRILAGYLKSLLAAPTPVSGRGPVVPGMLGKHPLLVGESGLLLPQWKLGTAWTRPLSLPLRLLLHWS